MKLKSYGLVVAAFCMVGCLNLYADFMILGGSFKNQNSGPVNFDTNNDSTADIVMSVVGNMGIGTTSPDNLLHVVGDGNVTQELYVGGNLTLEGSLLFGDGTVGMPSIAFSNDTDTGFFLSATGNLSLALAGTEELVVDSTKLKLNGVDLFTDRWLGLNHNTLLGMSVAGNGGLTHNSGTEGWYNTALGDSALYFNETGYRNTAIGYRAMYANDSGYSNTAVGYRVLNDNTTGINNTAMGDFAMEANTNGTGNSGFGVLTLFVNTSGKNNTAVGNGSLMANSTADDNTGVGTLSLSNNTTGERNSGFGRSALDDSTTGNDLTAAGYNTLGNNTTANNNSAFGAHALTDLTVGGNNSAFGFNAGYFNVIGEFNAFFGSEAGEGSTGNSNFNNSAFGFRSGHALTTGGNNSFFGFQSGDSITTGDRNILIGYDIDADTPTTNDYLNIGGVIYGDMSSGNTNITLTGNLIPSSNISLELGSTDVAWNKVYSKDYVMISDRRQKENIADLSHGLDSVLGLRPVSFNWKNDTPNNQHMGFIAQEVKEKLPQAVIEGKGKRGTMGVRYSELIPVLVRAIQEQNESMQSMREKMRDMDEQLRALKNQRK